MFRPGHHDTLLTQESAARPVDSLAPLVVGACLPLALIAAAVLVGIVAANGGMFVYTLDDPYIHLALSERIARGHYGLNAGEFAAPSSSILFPFLLAPFANASFHAYVPLFINLAALVAAVALLLRICETCGMLETPFGRRYVTALVALGCALFNIVGLAFTGMEHSLHVALTLAVVAGLIVMVDGRDAPWWFGAAVILGPFVRYEGLAVSAAATVALVMIGRPRLAAGLAAPVAAGLAAFSGFLAMHGLPLLPSSVLVKSEALSAGQVGSAAGLLAAVADNVVVSLRFWPGPLMILMAAVGAVALVHHRRRASAGPDAGVAAILVVVATAHVLFGRYNWFFRYELYALFAGFACLLFLGRATLRAALAGMAGEGASAGGSSLRILVLVPAILLVAGARYLDGTVLARDAANNVYDQQYQMHRFAVEFYKRPVAVNDLGWVAYRNPNYVLDLWGLGSEEARRVHGTANAGETFRALADRHDVGLVMVYEDWLGAALPRRWVPVARLHLSADPIIVGGRTVTFFATRADRVGEIALLLQSFSRTLPPGVGLDFAAGALPGTSLDLALRN